MSDKNISGLIQYNHEMNAVIKESIEQATIELMKTKPFKSISITELCKKAGVSRMGFYNNYSSKDDVIFSIIEKENQQLISTIGSPFRKTITLDWYKTLFNTIKKNKPLLSLMFDADFKYQYLLKINELVLHNVENITSEQKNMRILWAGAIVNRIIQWIDDDLYEQSDDLALFCYKKLNNFL